MNRGIFYAIGAYTIWGLIPIYIRLLQDVPAIEILAHRIVWSCVLLMGVILVRREWPGFRVLASNPRLALALIMAAILLSANWLTYILAVNSGRIVESSLGYFINPLVSILLGLVFLRERLRLWQWLAVGLAALGVLYLTISAGSVPWIGLILALTFGFYGLIKKAFPANALHGLAFETMALSLPAVVFLGYLGVGGTGYFVHHGLRMDFLLLLSGLITALPLFLFGAAVQRVNLSTIGLLQYMAPTGQFLLGVLVYGEPFTQDRLIGFGLIWIALAFYSLESLLWHKNGKVHARRKVLL
jgi:chloramphenicol-sensitive protein RarD